MAPRVSVIFLLLCSLHAASAAEKNSTQWGLLLPWANLPGDQTTPPTVYSNDRIIAFAGLEGESWTLAGTSTTGATVGQLLWTTQLPLGSSLPSIVAVAGDLAVLELDGRIFAVHPGNGSIAWNTTSPCSLGDPRMVNNRDTYETVYLVCNELSGDSTVIALSPADGSTTWALSTSSLAAKLTPVCAAAVAEGQFIYADTGSTITALSSADGALLWQVDVGRLPSTTITTTVTHLELAGDILLVREFSAGLNFSAGPFSYLALELNGTQAPSLLWAAAAAQQRDRLPDGVTEVSSVVRPSISVADDLLFYWSATVVSASPPPPYPPLSPHAPPSPPPLPQPPAAAPSPSPAPGMAVQWIEGRGTTTPMLNSGSIEEGGVEAETASAGTTAASLPASQAVSGGPAMRRRLAQAAASGANTTDNGLITADSTGPYALNLTVQGPPAADTLAVPPAVPEPPAPPAANATENGTAVVPPDTPGVAVETGGVGVVAPEGLVSFPVLKARSISTGQEVWSVQLQPVSAPSATEGAVAVVTPDGLQVLDAGTDSLLWVVDQKPIGIYPYAPTLVSGDTVAVQNCLNTVAANSLCIYIQASSQEGGAKEAPVLSQPDPAPAGEGEAAGTSGAAVHTVLLALLACAAVPLLLL